MNNKDNNKEEDYYIEAEGGYKVFTETYHLKRGYCCKSGCRHCPYGYDKKTDSYKTTNKSPLSVPKKTLPPKLSDIY